MVDHDRELTLGGTYVSSIAAPKSGRFSKAPRFPTAEPPLPLKRCADLGCSNPPLYNETGSKRALVCKDHQTPGMVKIVCRIPGCDGEPIFNEFGEAVGLFCSLHREENHVVVVASRALENSELQVDVDVPRWPEMWMQDEQMRRYNVPCNRNKLMHVPGIIYSGGIQWDDTLERLTGRRTVVNRQPAHAREIRTDPAHDRTAWVNGVTTKAGDIAYYHDFNISQGPAEYAPNYAASSMFKQQRNQKFAESARHGARIILDTPGPGDHDPSIRYTKRVGPEFSFGAPKNSQKSSDDKKWKQREGKLRERYARQMLNELSKWERKQQASQNTKDQLDVEGQFEEIEKKLLCKYEGKIQDEKVNFFARHRARRRRINDCKKDRSTFLNATLINGYMYESKPASLDVGPDTYSQQVMWGNNLSARVARKKKQRLGLAAVRASMHMRKPTRPITADKQSMSEAEKQHLNAQPAGKGSATARARLYGMSRTNPKPYDPESRGFVYKTAPRQILAKADRFHNKGGNFISKRLQKYQTGRDTPGPKYYCNKHEIAARSRGPIRHNMPAGRWC
jgi:hypothetical protein